MDNADKKFVPLYFSQEVVVTRKWWLFKKKKLVTKFYHDSKFIAIKYPDLEFCNTKVEYNPNAKDLGHELFCTDVGAIENL